MSASKVDFADVQGLVRFGYGKMTRAVYSLVWIKNAEAARAWLRTAPVTTAVTMTPPPATALNVAFTAPGLQALKVSHSTINSFSHEFRGGLPQESRARQLGDLGANAPGNWWWGKPGDEPHALIMFFAEPGKFSDFVETTKGSTWSAAFHEFATLPTSDLNEFEPFGFADGISQPKIDWEEQRDPRPVQMEYSNVMSLGEILLGYPNEYHKFTERPLLENSTATADLLPATDAPEKRDLGRNGTYLVMRQLEQDVRGFWRFVHEQSAGDPAEAEKLASAFVGRTRVGDPLVPARDRSDFTYDSDPHGVRCPFGAHIRRTNPRTSDFPQPVSGLKKLLTVLGFRTPGYQDDLISSVRYHRILRRGREYGSELLPQDALGSDPPNEAPRGLHFICLNANISRQFEFAQNAWIANTKFAGLTGESDALLGTRAAVLGCPVVSDFTWPRDGKLRRRVSGLPQFVTVRGGAYFFLPSLRALCFFARGSAG